MNLCQKKGSEGSAVEQERFSITVSTEVMPREVLASVVAVLV